MLEKHILELRRLEKSNAEGSFYSNPERRQTLNELVSFGYARLEYAPAASYSSLDWSIYSINDAGRDFLAAQNS